VGEERKEGKETVELVWGGKLRTKLSEGGYFPIRTQNVLVKSRGIGSQGSDQRVLKNAFLHGKTKEPGEGIAGVVVKVGGKDSSLLSNKRDVGEKVKPIQRGPRVP